MLTGITLKRTLAAVLVFAQVLMAPGLGTYRAIAAVVQVPSRIGTVPMGSAGGAGAERVGGVPAEQTMLA